MGWYRQHLLRLLPHALKVNSAGHVQRETIHAGAVLFSEVCMCLERGSDRSQVQKANPESRPGQTEDRTIHLENRIQKTHPRTGPSEGSRLVRVSGFARFKVRRKGAEAIVSG